MNMDMNKNTKKENTVDLSMGTVNPIQYMFAIFNLIFILFTI
jgi:hypothetical protein